jgi:hypothetical protein
MRTAADIGKRLQLPTTHAPRIPANGGSADRKPSTVIAKLGPPQLKPPQLPRQATVRRPHQPLAPNDFGVEIGGRPTFDSILTSVKAGNIERLKDRAFQANHIAKATKGSYRDACYKIKNKAISALFKHNAAFVNSVRVPFSTSQEAEIGVSFAGGGKLHTRPSLLDPEAQNIVRRHLADQPWHQPKAFSVLVSNGQAAGQRQEGRR